MEFVFYNKNYLKETSNGYEISSASIDKNPSGIKFKVEKNIKIQISLDLDIFTTSYLVEFTKDSYNIIKKIPIGKNYQNQLILKTNTNYLGIIYFANKTTKVNKIILRKFRIEKIKDNEVIPPKLNYHNTFFDQIYFINLEKRPERRNHIIKQLYLMKIDFKKVFPIKAVYLPNQPQIGCALSHMKALQHAYLNQFSKILILEDDFEFTVSIDDLNQKLKNLDTTLPNWDIVQFSTVNEKSSTSKLSGVHKVIKADTTAAYMVKFKHIKTLFNIFKNCLNPNPLIKGNKYAIDVAWQVIQPKLNWYLFKPNLGKQNETFPSDIELYRSYNWIF